MRNPIDLAEAYLQGVTGTWSRLGICIVALLIGHSLGFAAAMLGHHEAGFQMTRSHGFGEAAVWPFTLVMDWLSGCESLMGAIYVLTLPACWFFSVWLEWNMAKVAVGLITAQAWQSCLVSCSGWIFIFTEPVSQTFRASPGLYMLGLATAVSLGMVIGRAWMGRARPTQGHASDSSR